MAVYLGSEKIKINLGDVAYYLNIFTEIPPLEGIMLRSSDNYILRDKDGLYLTIERTD